MISLRKPEGSEVLPVGASAGPFSVIFFCGGGVTCVWMGWGRYIEWNGMGVDVMLEVEAQGGAREGRLGGGILGRHSLCACTWELSLRVGETQAGMWFLVR